MELRQLKYFIKVAETLNFSEAARVLFVTQSTLSQQVKQLENELGTELFIRSSHSVALTESGEELLPYARRTVWESEQCLQRISDLNQLQSGTLNIGVTYSFSPILTETIATFMGLHPSVKLNVFYKTMAELMELLRAREVDFVLAFRPTVPVDGVESHILFQNPLSAIVRIGHPLDGLKKVTLADLSQYNLAMPSKGLQSRNAFDNLEGRQFHDFKVRIELNEVNILLKLIRQSQLVSVLAEATIHDERGVRAIPLDVPGNEMAGCVHTLADSYHKKSMLEFVRLLTESIAVKERQIAWIG